MRVKASVTVMMTMVITIIMTFMLVILEQDYRACLKTLELQSFDKSLESTLGNFYAPLWVDYGLIAIPLGEGFAYKDMEALEEAVKDNYNYPFLKSLAPGVSDFLWNSRLIDVKITQSADLFSNSGSQFIKQAVENVNYDLALYATEEIKKLLSDKSVDLPGFTAGISNELKRPEKDEDSDSEENDAESDENKEDKSDDSDKPESSYSKIKKTLKAFLKDGFAGWWFEDNEALSEEKLVKKELPSSMSSEPAEDELFSELEISEEELEDDSYLDKLSRDELIERFSTAVESVNSGTGDKFKLLMYANQRFGSYVNPKEDTRLCYEQEYLAFGNEKDETNVKRASWAIFGIREALNLVTITKSPLCQEKLSEWLGAFDVIPVLAVALKSLAITVWATQNALVETSAILHGKRVDFYPKASSLSVKFSEIFTMTKDKIQRRAKAYKGDSLVKLTYESYLLAFMSMKSSEKLCFRMMDLIELNIQRKYNPSFKLKNCLVGFSAEGNVASKSKYLGIPSFSVDGYKYLQYKDTVKSAVYCQ